MIYYQGDNIKFNIGIKQISSSDEEDWSAFRSIIVYFWTDQSFVAKFKNDQEHGYETLTLSEDKKTISGTIPSEHTISMVGSMRMSIRVIDNNGDIKTKDIPTRITIVSTPIKHEK